MYIVYRIVSESNPHRAYIGITQNMRERLKKHNNGSTKTTKGTTDWEVVFYAAFREKETAYAFEAYLKTGSGYAFSRKRLWPGY